MAGDLGTMISKSAGGLPIWAWVAAAGGGLLIGWYFLRKTSGGASPASAPSAASQSLADNPPPNNGSGTGQTQQILNALVRGKGSSDGSNSAGVPLRLSPNDYTTVGQVPFNAQIQLSGPPTNGQNNFNDGTPGGSTLWYPVTYGGASGWLSAYDIGSILGQWQGATQNTIVPATAHLH